MVADRLALAVVLVAAAGWVDAVGFIQFAGLFVSFMSGSSTQLGVSLGEGEWVRALAPSLAIASFVAGSFVATLISAGLGVWHSPAILALESTLLLGALGLPAGSGEAPLAILPLALAMGAQNAVLDHVGDRPVGLTFVTGTLVKLGRSLAGVLLGKEKRGGWVVYAWLWLGLIVGAVGGAAAEAKLGLDALAVPAGGLGVLCLVETARLLRTARR
jgi:uncharacterized membrane protein YoaK (UPF0700 family)